jgi:hypothetical protein
MKLAAAKSPKGAMPRREQMAYERAQSAAMRKAFPQIEQLRIELAFGDTRSVPPSPQVHTLYPAAAAFFRFACPCADCDGDFDLTDAITALAKSGIVTSRGQLICGGTRRDRPPGGAACSVRLDYRLTSV